MRVLQAAFWLLFIAHAQGAPAERIISIGGAQTEILYGLGFENRIMGVDSTSTWPREALLKPQVGYQRSLSSEGILSLRPDLVVLPPQAGPASSLEQLKSAEIPLIHLPDSQNLESIRQKIKTLAVELEVPERGSELLRQFDLEVETLTQARISRPLNLRVVFIMQYSGPKPMVAGTHTAAHEALKLVGATHIVMGYEGYKILTPESIIALAPDAVVVGTQTLQALGGVEAILSLPGFSQTPAARSKRVIEVDTFALLNFGLRTPSALISLHNALEDSK